MLQNRKGFTLIELLIVVVIIGILAAVAIPRFGESRERAYISAMQSDLRQVMTAQEMYYVDNDYTYATATLVGPGGSGEEEAADAPFAVTPSAGVTLKIEGGTAGEWYATATHAAAPDQSCAVFVGETKPTDLDHAEQSGVIACGGGSEE